MNSAPHTPDPAPSPELIEAAAAAWLSLRDRGMSAAETAEFVRWLQQDPQHATVFAELDAVWKNFDRLGAVPVSNAPAPNADLLAPRVRPRHHRTLTWSVLGAAAAAAIVLFSVTQFRAPRHSAETAVGAFQKIDLPDGSVAQLNTDTAIDTTFTATERRVRVVRGEVFFTVTKDPARPFIVTAGPVAVRAIGTAFNVRHDPSGIEILVTEGRVRVDDADKGQSLLAPVDAGMAPPLLVAGERALVPVRASDSVPAVASVAKVAAAGVQRALAWQERRLEFDAEPLGEVVREFNRYNRTRLVIADEQLATKRFSGTFRADGYESLVRLLESDFGVTATRSERGITLRVRR
jgi:transmembrane sensor